ERYDLPECQRSRVGRPRLPVPRSNRSRVHGALSHHVRCRARSKKGRGKPRVLRTSKGAGCTPEAAVLIIAPMGRLIPPLLALAILSSAVGARADEPIPPA